MTVELMVNLVGLGIGLVLALIVFLLVYRPMRKLLGVNSVLAAARSFYARTFVIMLLLVVWAGVLGMDLTGAAKGSTTRPASEDPTFMEAVWAVARHLEHLLRPMALVLGLYVVMLTVLYAAVGRYRDQ